MVSIIERSEIDISQIIHYVKKIYPGIVTDSKEEEIILIRKCIREGHHSVLTHMHITCEIKCSRCVMSELLTRGIQLTKVNELQTGKDLNFIVPSSVMNEEGTMKIFANLIEDTRKLYNRLNRCRSEISNNYILPGCIEETILISQSYFGWLKILRMKYDPTASEELQEICSQLFELFNDECSQVFNSVNLRLKLLGG